jgi:hypothetical protein
MQGIPNLWNNSGIPNLWNSILQPCNGRGLFQSDHCFDSFISPVTNPFLFVDPRSLTEVRPIFMYQSTPSHNPVFQGGDIEYFGLYASVALTERLSLIINRLGFVSSEPHNGTPDFQPHTGFSEFWLGPQYTFLRNENSGTLGAFGLIFQIPTGPAQVQQDTGNLSLTPYVTLGQKICCSLGDFHALGTVGYAFGTDSARSEYLYTSLHLDWDFLSKHCFYPLVEMNWFHYTEAGTARDVPGMFEGRDLFNFGTRGVSGHDNLSLAVGFRYKFSECIQWGLATEWGVTGKHDLNDFRLTIDLIFRY